MLDLELDPKRAWALRNPHLFPLDVNRAPREMLLRVPGLGVRVVDRIVAARRSGALRLEDVARVCRRISAVRPFLSTPDWRPSGRETPDALARSRRPQQLELFA
jgi:predicted DNA-binding helix-hairpin-helix protein